MSSTTSSVARIKPRDADDAEDADDPADSRAHRVSFSSRSRRSSPASEIDSAAARRRRVHVSSGCGSACSPACANASATRSNDDERFGVAAKPRFRRAVRR